MMKNEEQHLCLSLADRLVNGQGNGDMQLKILMHWQYNLGTYFQATGQGKVSDQMLQAADIYNSVGEII